MCSCCPGCSWDVHPKTGMAVIRQARELHESGLALRKIAIELDQRGFTARNGKPFQATQIRRMVA